MSYIHYIIIFLLLAQLGISVYNLSYKNENYQGPIPCTEESCSQQFKSAYDHCYCDSLTCNIQTGIC